MSALSVYRRNFVFHGSQLAGPQWRSPDGIQNVRDVRDVRDLKII